MTDSAPPVNIARRLRASAEAAPHQAAVVMPAGVSKGGRVTYEQLTFQQLDQESDRLARGLLEWGVPVGSRLVLMVRPSIEFIALTFALFKAGMTVVLIDPGMGRSNIFRCLKEVDPAGFVAIPIVHLIRIAKRKLFPNAEWNVTVGRKLGWKGLTYNQLQGEAWTPFEPVATSATDLAAIIFTSGSTGPPKGVQYEHGMFDAQVDLLRDRYDIRPGEVDLPGFPPFALFNAAMRVTTVIPDMDPTRPADVDPTKILQAIHDHGVTQAFGSPALWNTVSRYCAANNVTIPNVKRVLSAGAPVPVPVLKRMRQVLEEPDARMHTPYGATECLPIASTSDEEVLGETAEKTNSGAGTCVGWLFPEMTVRIIEITDDAIPTIDDATEVPIGTIGEVIVQGPVATRRYDRAEAATARAKITDGDTFWHRMGDVGYFDAQGRLWFCGRKAHIVTPPAGRLFTIPCEAIFNNHPDIYRSALVGVGVENQQTPVIICEPEASKFPKSAAERKRLASELFSLGRENELTSGIGHLLFHESLPVDTRHNVKIRREQLSEWAAECGERGEWIATGSEAGADQADAPSRRTS